LHSIHFAAIVALRVHLEPHFLGIYSRSREFARNGHEVLTGVVSEKVC